MAKKRADGEGTVSQRSDGRWMARLSVGRDAGGKAHRVTIYGATQAEVVTKLQALRQQRDVNAKSLYGKGTVAAYLQRWLENDVAVNLEDKTHQEYEMSARLYVTPFIGHLKLAKLDGEQLVAWQATLKRKKFTANMRSRSIKVLSAALNKAVKLRLIPFSPCNVLDKPKLSRKEVTPLEPEQCHALFHACKKHRLGDVMILAGDDWPPQRRVVRAPLERCQSGRRRAGCPQDVAGDPWTQAERPKDGNREKSCLARPGGRGCTDEAV